MAIGGLVLFTVSVILSAVKLLLIPAYVSTDFEVHRNWLAITHSLPLSRWYIEHTSEWTLDYPPLFAWFEFILSQFAIFFDPRMLEVNNLKYKSVATVVFQRLSVIITDFMFIYAAKVYCSDCLSPKKGLVSKSIFESKITILFLLLTCNFGLFFVDHMHFQYNGFMFGLWLLSITKISQGSVLEGAFWFSLLLNFKHIFLYVAPAYFIFLLRNYCFKKNNKDGTVCWMSFSFQRFLSLGFVVVSVFALSLGPFIILNQIPQLLSRLFPVARGLCHAYWAPNIWALYNVADKIATVAGAHLGLLTLDNQTAAMTGGLVQQTNHITLPSIQPIVTLVTTLMAIIPCILHQWFRPTGIQGFVRSLALCAFGSFLFGWHVHEKAILLVILPMILLSVQSRADAQLFLFLSTVGHSSLFPLVFTAAETPIKYITYFMYTIYSFGSVPNLFRPSKSLLPMMSLLECVYLVGLVLLELYCSVIHDMLSVTSRLPFLPLMLRSSYCAVGIIYSWFRLYHIQFTSESLHRPTKQKTH